MINTEGVVLKLLLHSKNNDQALLAFSRLKEKYFSEPFKPLYRAISDFYGDTGALPTYTDLQIANNRDKKLGILISSLDLVPIEDMDIELATEAFLDSFAQDTVLDLMTQFIDKLPLLSRDEMMDALGNFPIAFEQSIHSTEKVKTVKELTTFRSSKEAEYVRVLLGLSNKLDNELPAARQDLLLFGGHRGSGKSILCANIVANQLRYNNIGVYFTIEMTDTETFQRIQSISAQVPYTRIKNNELTQNDINKLCRWLANQYDGGIELYESLLETNPAPDHFEFEKQLKSTCELKQDNQLVIIDDRELSLSAIDVQISKLKAKHGDKLQVAVVDYLNQVVWDGHEAEMYDWKVQVVIAKQLKNLARKHDILIVSPYQIDEDGRARFSKGILDACDTAQLIRPDKETSTITLEPTKVRSGADSIHSSVAIDWDCLTIHPQEVDLDKLKPEPPEEEEFSPFPTGAADL